MAAGLFTLSANTGRGERSLQTYPNVDGAVLFENDQIVVQRFVFQPGVWEGVHSHPGNQLSFTSGAESGRFAAARTGKPRFTKTARSGGGPAIDINEDHESGNTGKTPIDLIWMTLKQK